MPRERIVERLRRELMGYGVLGQNERIPERPSFRYLIGQLYPACADQAAADEQMQLGNDTTDVEIDTRDEEPRAAATVRADEEGELDDRDDPHAGENQDDDTPRVSHPFLPQSIGLTCNVSPEATWVDAEVDFGTYREVPPPGGGRGRSDWERTHRNHQHRIPIPSSDSTLRDSISFPGAGASDPAATLEWIIRRNRDADGEVTVILSAFLINSTAWPLDDADPDRVRVPEDGYCLFQPALRLMDREGSLPFVDRKPESRWASTDPDLERFKLLFRCYPEFAVGHGCAASWSGVSNDLTRSASVFTELIPEHELPRVVYDPLELAGASTRFLEMNHLAGLAVEDLRPELSTLQTAYRRWIAAREAEVAGAGFPANLITKAREHLDGCLRACRRIEDGIDLLCSNADVLHAFRFMNEVIELQQRHVGLVRLRREAETQIALGRVAIPVSLPPSGPAYRWRPFQLAFILMNLRGLVEPGHADRRLVDLLWFPTAGGKTEAYLGLTAFILALRRLRARGQTDPQLPRGDGGVTVIMRYTLRLLTSQQFQRAAALICACELARERHRFGTEPFLIGMWVGSALTPNGVAEAAEVLRGGRSLNGGDPRQLERCPWCGTRLTTPDYTADADTARLSIRCPEVSCEFHHTDLPILLIDEQIYGRCPSLLIGTVDKFARLPWQKSFSVTLWHC